jgi:hypothetical protein
MAASIIFMAKLGMIGLKAAMAAIGSMADTTMIVFTAMRGTIGYLAIACYEARA